jgi:hypothetical protein
MLRRISLVLFTLFVLCSLASGPAGRVRADESATISPDSGSLRTTFTFSVSGMTPGHGISIAVYDAAGVRYTYQKDGIDQAIIVDEGGNASLQITPATDLGDPASGTWKVVFVEEETGNSVTIPFAVSG